ncbi:hypothetical protein [Pseudomonas sp.]|uniref:hypothetical protein n=1 Tax=Pseudomonas sp. TaxID=306 RepID=UPI001B058E4D|nr:hypothetical protein [Pseudomonas sp.]MBO9550990.1 hypothetical protein [Pseudomonas sp.]
MTDQISAMACGKAVESSLLPFAGNVDGEAREDILLVIRFAHAAATQEQAEGLNPHWFNNYRRKLSFLGWDATPPPVFQRPVALRRQVIDMALQQIGQVGSPEHLKETERFVRGLQRDHELIKRVETRMRESNTIQFQLMPCVRRSGDYYEMVLYQMQLLALETSKNFLFVKGDLAMTLMGQSAELIRFNLRLFRDQYKQKVQSRVASLAHQQILDIEL